MDRDELMALAQTESQRITAVLKHPQGRRAVVKKKREVTIEERRKAINQKLGRCDIGLQVDDDGLFANTPQPSRHIGRHNLPKGYGTLKGLRKYLTKLVDRVPERPNAQRFGVADEAFRVRDCCPIQEAHRKAPGTGSALSAHLQSQVILSGAWRHKIAF
jgi:hypothetical protein